MRGRGIQRAVLLVLLIAMALPASAAAADTPALKVAVDPPSRADMPGGDQYVIGTRQPTFHVQADFSQAPGAVAVRCHVDTTDAGPCGTQDGSGCPTTQCWTYTPPAYPSDGDGHVLTVEIVDSNGDDTDNGVAGVFFSIDTTPPDTALARIGGNDFPIDFADERHVIFGFQRADNDANDGTFECALTSLTAQAPSSWFKCSPEERLRQKLGLTASYRFWVRAVDFLGRPDESPATYVFSPTPCHLSVLGHPHRLRAIVQHGLRLRMSCVQPTGFELALLLNTQQLTSLHLPSPLLGVVSGRTTTPQTSRTFTLHTLKGLPKVLFRQKRLFVGLSTRVLGNPPKLVELKLHR